MNRLYDVARWLWDKMWGFREYRYIVTTHSVGSSDGIETVYTEWEHALPDHAAHDFRVLDTHLKLLRGRRTTMPIVLPVRCELFVSITVDTAPNVHIALEERDL